MGDEKDQDEAFHAANQTAVSELDAVNGQGTPQVERVGSGQIFGQGHRGGWYGAGSV